MTSYIEVQYFQMGYVDARLPGGVYSMTEAHTLVWLLSK